MEKESDFSNREENGPMDLSIKPPAAIMEKTSGTRCLRNTDNFLEKGKQVRNIEDFELLDEDKEKMSHDNFCFVPSSSLLSSREIGKACILVDSRVNKKQMEFSIIPFAMHNTTHFDKYSIASDGIEEHFSLMELSDGQVCLVPLLSSVYNIAQNLSSIRNYITETEDWCVDKLSARSCVKEKKCDCQTSSKMRVACFCDSRFHALISKRNSSVLENTSNFSNKASFSRRDSSSQSSSGLHHREAKKSFLGSADDSLHFENWRNDEESLEVNMSAEDLSVNKTVEGVKNIFKMTSENLGNFNSLKNFCHSYDDTTTSELVQKQSPTCLGHSDKRKLFLSKEVHLPSKPLATLPVVLKTIGEQRDSVTSNLHNLLSSGISNSLPIHESPLFSKETLNDRDICLKGLHELTSAINPWNVYDHFAEMSHDREVLEKHLGSSATAFTRTPFEAKGAYPVSYLPTNTQRYTTLDRFSHVQENARGDHEKMNYSAVKQSFRVLTRKHVKFGAGASPSTLLILRHKIQERQKVKKFSVMDRVIPNKRTNESVKKRRR
ncbi:uncharacterized protein LOC143244521 [Tachypleus tridentatus]|uniref:uncharacterized protein LOC143244521 n=1 Tax=Tachypleus tridentatus TaxID=6853 RepID=UPI003FD68BA0